MTTKIEYFNYKRQRLFVKLSQITTDHKSAYTFKHKSTSCIKVRGKAIDNSDRSLQINIVLKEL